MGNLRMNADQISYKGGEKPMSVEEAIKNAGNTGLAHTADIAPDFSTESAYSAGDYVYHNGTLYVFTSNHAAGAWSNSDTQAATVGGEIATLTGEAADLYSGKANQITIAPFFSENTAYDPGDLVYYNGLTYRCVNSHEGAWDADDFAATTIANELSTLMSGLTNLMKVPSQTKTTIGYADIDGTNPVEISVSNLTNYDFIICGISYYATGLANYGIVTIPVSELTPMLDDAGTPIIILAMGGGLGYLRVKFNTNKDKIIFTPDAATNLPGRYYFIHGINIRG